jgi:hypothetical protein
MPFFVLFPDNIFGKLICEKEVAGTRSRQHTTAVKIVFIMSLFNRECKIAAIDLLQ